MDNDFATGYALGADSNDNRNNGLFGDGGNAWVGGVADLAWRSLHPLARDGRRVRLHRGGSIFGERGYLGVHIGNLPAGCAGERAGLWRRGALGDVHARILALPGGSGAHRNLRLRLFRGDNAGGGRLGNRIHARNERPPNRLPALIRQTQIPPQKTLFGP